MMRVLVILIGEIIYNLYYTESSVYTNGKPEWFIIADYHISEGE